MNNKASQPIHAGVGTASIILIFFVLCLSSFGVLSLISAHNNEVSTDKSTNFICSYYEASAQANEFIAFCKVNGLTGDYSESFSINDQLDLEVSFHITEDGDLSIERFRTIDSQSFDDLLIDFE